MRSHQATAASDASPAEEQDAGPGWYDAAERYLDGAGSSSWRSYCDALHGDLIRELLGGERSRRALKTDLFDEAAGRGLADALSVVADEVHGIDISRRIAETAQGRNPRLAIRVDDIRRSALPDAHFDLVVSNSTLDHFPSRRDVERALAEIHRVLAPGGRLLVTLDNLANPVVALRSVLPFGLLHRLRLCPFVVGVTLTPGGLRRELARTGFAVEEERVAMHVPRILAVWLCAVLDRLVAPSSSGSVRLRRLLSRAESMARLPTRNVTGYYAVALARKR